MVGTCRHRSGADVWGWLVAGLLALLWLRATYVLGQTVKRYDELADKHKTLAEEYFKKVRQQIEAENLHQREIYERDAALRRARSYLLAVSFTGKPTEPTIHA